MKARVKATGEIGKVTNIDLLFDKKEHLYQSDEVEIIDSYAEVDTDNDTEIDYWTRLEHTYAGMAMQGMMAHTNIDYDEIVDLCVEFAHALVEKLKEKEK